MNSEEKKQKDIEKGATIPTPPDKLPEDIGEFTNNKDNKKDDKNG